MIDKFNLARFIAAQNGKYEDAVEELRSGRKKSHWMWFIFPQVDGLGMSETSRKFGIKSLQEAREYLEHPVLGTQLRECTQAVLNLEKTHPSDVFGYPDDLKFRSSMTLFSFLEGENSVFQRALNRYFGGVADNKTLEILSRFGGASVSVNMSPALPKSVDFRVFAQRVAKVEKAKCGDSFAVELLEDGNILILVVADGVSSSPCDWKAAEVACETVVDIFKSSEGSIALRMGAAAEKAHTRVKLIGDRCAGSITSLTFVAWETMTDEIHVLNVGDSRAYLGPDNDLRQLTADDVQPVILKRNGEVVLQAGVPVFMRGVTRSLGQLESLEFSVQSHAFRRGDLLVLVSDGMSKYEAFTSAFPAIFGSANVEERLSSLLLENSAKNQDDATLVVVWRVGIDEFMSAKFDDCIVQSSDFRKLGLNPTQVVAVLKKDLLSKMSNYRNEEVSLALDYAERYGIRFDRDFLAALLTRAIQQGTDRRLVERLRGLIRRASV